MKLVAHFLESLDFDGIYPDSDLDELQEAGVYYDRFQNTIFTRYVTVPAPVRTAKELRGMLSHEEAKLLEPGEWKAFIGWEICLSLYELTGLPTMAMKKFSSSDDRKTQEYQWKIMFRLLLSTIKKYVRHQEKLKAVG